MKDVEVVLYRFPLTAFCLYTQLHQQNSTYLNRATQYCVVRRQRAALVRQGPSGVLSVL
jgi:hypothetical protein